MKTKEAIERVRSRFDKWALDEEDLTALQTLGLANAESEDEMIRKDIIGGLMWQRDNLESEGPHDNNLILPGFCFTVGEHLAYLEKQKTSEEAIRYIKENHSSDEVSDFQAAMNIAVAKAYDKGVQDTLEKQKEKKLAEWSEEDEEMIKYFEELLDYAFKNWTRFEGNAINALNWLKSIPERINLQPKHEWSDDDEAFLDSIEEAVSSYYDLNHAPQYHYWLENKLKSIYPSPDDEITYITPNKDFFNWIYNRLLYVYHERPEMDYMQSFKERIDNLPDK